MSALLNALKWVAIPVVTTLIAVGVWYVIDEEQDLILWAVTGLVIGVLIVLVIFLVLFLRNRNKAGKLESGLGAGGGMDQRGEVEALRKAWKDSLATLRASGVGGGGKRALQALPWFVIIGAPASGKSTLLRQSGIDFPVGDAALRGLQGTRNCDWWFSNVGIFLDTAGRYISDQSAQEWARFLELVRKQRSGAPINGCIVAVPASDLIERTPEQVELDARRIRARLDELIDHLGISFPVWVVITKVDLIGGFAEFFNGLDATGRAQMMGWTADLTEGGAFDRTRFRARFDAVVHRLREIRPQLLHGSKLLDRPMAFAFPDQLAALAEPLSRMMHRIFEPNVYQETPFFRGLYITSATQEGTPLQKAAARVRQLLGAAAAIQDTSQGLIKHCYFVKDLMHERIVQDRHMTWTTKKEVERGKLKRLGMNLTGASFGVLLTLLVLGFGMRARKELDKVSERLGQAQSSQSGVATCDGLWMAAAATKDDNYSNLAMSHQRTLKRKLEKEQAQVFRTDVLLPLVAGFQTDLSRTDTTLEEHVATYEAFREVRVLLERTAKGEEAEASPFEKKETPDEGSDDEGDDPKDDAGDDEKDASEPLPGGPPAGFYGPSARARLIARRARLRSDGVIGPKSGKERFVEPLLTCLWRNRAEIHDLDASYEAVDVAFRARVQDFVTRSRTAITAFEADTNASKDFLTGWLNGFVSTCSDWRDQLTSSGLRDADLMDALAQLIAAAKGEAKQGTESAGQHDLGLLGSIPGTLDDLKARGLVSDADLSGMEGFDQVGGFDPKTSGVKREPGTAAPDDAVRTALNDIAEQLATLERQQANVVAVPWKIRKSTIGEALGQIDELNETFSATWKGRLTPLLQPIAAAAAGPDGPPAELPDWTIAVLELPGALHRDAHLAEFLKGNEAFKFERMASVIAENRAAERDFSQAALKKDLRALIPVVEYAVREDRLIGVTPGVRNRATQAVDKAYGGIVNDRARTYWDERFDNLALFQGDGWEHLAEWAPPTGGTRKVMQEVAREFDKPWPLDASLRAGSISAFASRVWQHAENLQRRYAPFAQHFPRISTSVETLLSYKSVNLEDAAAMDKLADDLRGGGGQPRWHLGQGVWGSGGDVAGLAKALGNLQQAFEAAEEWLLLKMRDQFNSRWRSVRGELERARSTGDAVALQKATQSLESLSQSLRPVFGDRLGNDILGRLKVNPTYLDLADALRGDDARRDRFEQGLSLTMTCHRVPIRGGMPVVRVVYDEGGSLQTEAWDPTETQEGKRRTFEIRFKPGQGTSFSVFMVPDKKVDASKGFRVASWKGPDCVIQALRAGGSKHKYEKLVFSGQGVDGDAEFDYGSTDYRDLEYLLNGGGSAAATDDEMPQECVILDKK